MNSVRTEKGGLTPGDLPGAGEAAIQLAPTATEPLSPGGLRPEVHITAFSEFGSFLEEGGRRKGETRRTSLDDVARLMGTFLVEGRAKQEWSRARCFLRGTLDAQGVLCRSWQEERLCLSGTSGPLLDRNGRGSSFHHR